MTKAIIAPQLAANEVTRKNSRAILRDVIERFGDYSDVEDYVNEAKRLLEADGTKVTVPPGEPSPKS